MVRKLRKGTGNRAVLAAIARREWLLQMLALGAAGCGRVRLPATEAMLTISVPIGESETLFTDSSSQFLLFLPLVTRNAKGELEGRLAERWEHTPDYRIWTIHLRKDVRWQDGVPVTEHDINSRSICCFILTSTMGRPTPSPSSCSTTARTRSRITGRPSS